MLLFECDYCGRSAIIEFDLETHLSDLGRANPQGLASCAQRNRELNRQFPRVFPLWVPRKDERSRRNAVTGDALFYVQSIDDVVDTPVDHAEKPLRLLAQIADRVRRTSALATTPILRSDIADAALVGPDELFAMVQHLVASELVTGWKPVGVTADTVLTSAVRMTIKGWDATRVHAPHAQSSTAFVAMKFAWPGDEEEKLRLAAYAAIQEACRSNGFEASIVSQAHTDNITDRIVAEIRAARFVIAELSYNNQGVYFESGFARGLGKQVFHVIRADHLNGADHEGKRIHFDIAQVMYRTWTTPDELREKLRVWIAATMNA